MIEVKNLTKRYGSHTAVSNLSFHIETGQIYGFLGPNGAGKSTTMNIMTGCLAATEGEVTVGDTISLRMRPRPSGALATCPSGLPSTWTGRLWNTSPLWDRPRA